MAVYRRGKTWWYVFEHGGRRIQESSGFRNKTAAIRAEAKRRTDLQERRAGFAKVKQAPKFGDFVEQFLRISEQQHRPKTYELHCGNCKVLKRFFRGEWLDEITQGMVEDFKVTRIQEKRWGKRKQTAVSGVTVNRALSTLRLIFNHAERCGFRVSNPVKHVTFFREVGRTRIISIEEEHSYLAAASQPLRDIARIMLDTGMRPEEVFRMERGNIDFGQRTMFNPFGKTRAARRKLTMTDDVWSILKRRAASSESPYVFPSPDRPQTPIGSVRKAHDAAVRRTNIAPAFRLYDLRHTYASRAVMAGVDLPTLAALLGHTSVQMTMRYVHPAEEHKREATAKIERFKKASAIDLATRSQGVPTKVTTVERVH
jgi:integrase